MSYNGWSNRDTWCAALWLTNDEGLHEMAREMTREQLEEWVRDEFQEALERAYQGSMLGSLVVDLFHPQINFDELYGALRG